MSTDYTVRLSQVFQGPMDLLLHLVREQEVEIQEIEISRVIDGYLEYLSAMDALDIEYAGDFLVMAATLMAIKARSLLPHEELDLEDELDPKDELIQRLIEYRRFRGAADELNERYIERARMHARGWRGELRDMPVEREFDLGELTVFDLLAEFSRLMRETLTDEPHRIASDPRPLRFYVESVVGRLREHRTMTLRDLRDAMADVPPREALIGSFCALLELVKMELIRVEQGASREDIRIALSKEHVTDADAIVRESLLDEELAQPAPGAAADATAATAPVAENGATPDPEPPAPGASPAPAG